MAKPGLSAAELQNKLRQRLQETGAVDKLQADLRNRVLGELVQNYPTPYDKRSPRRDLFQQAVDRFVGVCVCVCVCVCV